MKKYMLSLLLVGALFLTSRLLCTDAQATREEVPNQEEKAGVVVSKEKVISFLKPADYQKGLQQAEEMDREAYKNRSALSKVGPVVCGTGGILLEIMAVVMLTTGGDWKIAGAFAIIGILNFMAVGGFYQDNQKLKNANVCDYQKRHRMVSEEN